MATYEFAIKKDVLASGKIIYTPVVRIKSRLGRFNIFPNPWERITQIYDEYLTMDLNFAPDLSFKECEDHIKGYQNKLLQRKQNDVITVEYDNLEEEKY